MAFVHRLVLQLWATLSWLLIGQPFHENAYNLQASYGASMLTPLQGIQDAIFGVWRRWDAVHYLRLAEEGYTTSTIDISVFPPLAPFAISAIKSILPISIDAAAMIFNTLMFALTLIFLFRICEIHFEDRALARWSICLLAILPLSYVFVAPMAESVYMAMTLGCIYFALKRQWLGSGLWGLLASAARSQGMLLLCFVGLILLWKEWDKESRWTANLVNLFKKGLPLAIIPLGFVAFVIFRSSLGLPDLHTLYYANWNTVFVNPVTGLWLNFRWFIVNFPESLARADVLVLIGVLVLIPFLFIKNGHRNVIFIAYTITYLCLFLSPISNYEVDPNLAFTVSLGRYCLSLFPLTILLADMLRTSTVFQKIIVLSFLGGALLLLTALNTMGLTSA